MPMGSAIPRGSAGMPVTAAKLSTKKSAYLNQPSRPRLMATDTRNARRLFGTSRPRAHAERMENTISSRYFGSPYP